VKEEQERRRKKKKKEEERRKKEKVEERRISIRKKKKKIGTVTKSQNKTPKQISRAMNPLKCCSFPQHLPANSFT